jgi:hypothetical protein
LWTAVGRRANSLSILAKSWKPLASKCRGWGGGERGRGAPRGELGPSSQIRGRGALPNLVARGRRDLSIRRILGRSNCGARSGRNQMDHRIYEPEPRRALAAIDAGLGISVRTPAGLPAHLSAHRESSGLPALPTVVLALHASAALASAGEQLRAVLVESLTTSPSAAL